MGAVIVLSLKLAKRAYRHFLKITLLDLGDRNWILPTSLVTFISYVISSYV